MTFKIKCKHLTEKPFDIEIEGSTTVAQIKEKIAEHTSVDSNMQKIIFKGNYPLSNLRKDPQG